MPLTQISRYLLPITKITVTKWQTRAYVQVAGKSKTEPRNVSGTRKIYDDTAPHPTLDITSLLTLLPPSRHPRGAEIPRCWPRIRATVVVQLPLITLETPVSSLLPTLYPPWTLTPHI